MSRDAFKLDVVSIRLVRDAPIYSDQKLNSPQAAVHLVGEVLCDMDRELVCVINLSRWYTDQLQFCQCRYTGLFRSKSARHAQSQYFIKRCQIDHGTQPPFR